MHWVSVRSTEPSPLSADGSWPTAALPTVTASESRAVWSFPLSAAPWLESFHLHRHIRERRRSSQSSLLPQSTHPSIDRQQLYLRRQCFPARTR
ncbi:hypothetical protein PF005_g16349 [Phytophthora fragariae]|uniref:Uncharacterized protein n=1 Tax=Phytophthora fragariae TaxID=53985 RepID=A0A6A3RG50_9STRA|nr:hypothetical protein PF009_g17155 [Phytophthora fragariae]KAE9095796.1 hypothetical protein PF007_g17253 [Phytophthora fragariae]KAE9129126.1 hypothetical protein PF006_g16103 [Phytophthora fragariae]KAE9197868.1 hypothetical protein PF005_g16349 [Phytophthora fragariae]KAE9212954.1 hypothetical protein PF002_g18110 [Phytophthora fragariae]